ncbi:hypothetical protein GX48_07337 [Paracoccidioides brasiliensis]|nr:hypothetical protein GX48_07337 [Paracoccidioides brasiliensis]
MDSGEVGTTRAKDAIIPQANFQVQPGLFREIPPAVELSAYDIVRISSRPPFPAKPTKSRTPAAQDTAADPPDQAYSPACSKPYLTPIQPRKQTPPTPFPFPLPLPLPLPTPPNTSRA